jgi:hypothetical protein
MGCAAYLKSWDFAIGSSIRMVGNEAALSPPTGGLLFLLVDDEVVKIEVMSTSPAAIAIERDGWRVHLTQKAFGSSDRASPYPVSEWIIASRFEGAPCVPS